MATWDEILYLNQCLLKSVINSRDEVKTIEIVLEQKKTGNYLHSFLKNSPKINMKIQETAKKFRTQANFLFNATPSNTNGAIELYTKAICCAGSETLELGLSHANRGLALMKINRFAEAYDDCQVAIESNYPMDKLMKVLLRKATCSAQLKNVLNLTADLKDVRSHAELKKLSAKDNEIYFELQERQRLLLNQAGEQTTTSALSDSQPTSLTELCDTHKGRYVVAPIAFTKNDLITTEKAFAFVPVYEPKSVISYDCQNCAAVNIIPFPCVSCKLASYCSSICRMQHRKIHDMECAGYKINLWAQIGIAHLAARTFVIGLEQILEICKGKSFKNAGDLFRYLSELSEHCENFKYGKVFSLVTNFDKMSLPNYSCYAGTSFMMTLYFKFYTKLFESLGLKTLLPNIKSQEVFVGSLILRHVGQLVCNGHAITNIRTTLPSIENCYNAENIIARGKLHIFLRIVRAFTAIFPNISMLNHSCNPNIRNRFELDSLMIYATRPIPVNAEIYNCYGPHFKQQDKVERQKMLKEQYSFDCACEKCVLNEDSDDDYSQFICQNSSCHKKVYVREVETFGEYSKKIQCKHCDRNLSIKFAQALESYLADENWIELLRCYKNYAKNLNKACDYNLNFVFSILIQFLPEAENNSQLHIYLTELAIELLEVRKSQFGIFSMEFAKDSVYLLDLLTVRKVNDNLLNEKVDEKLCEIRKSLKVFSVSVQKIYWDYLKQYMK